MSKRVRCPHCRRFYALNKSGELRRHGTCRRVHETELRNGGEIAPANHPSQMHSPGLYYRGPRARAGRRKAA